ncbi:MAG TPA: GNAT family N-acetyltransferase [Nannocystaceae bacterium]|nr:GNAT family N-acetyltransferase [Nannocystaceae bacterium]
MHVRRIRADDRTHWLRMRAALWPGALVDHDTETRAYFEHGGGTLVVLVAELDGALVGFLELDERKYAAGCEESPVAFIEGWFVDAHVRGRGVGRALVAAAEQLALDHGHAEIASDSELDNTPAHAAHLALGFVEIERVVCFRKPLRPR